MKKLAWFDRQFTFGLPQGMLPFYLERLEGTVVRLQEKVRGHSEEMLSTKPDGKWSVKQNIGHLAEVDEIANRRIDEIRTGAAILSPAVFEPRLDYNALTIVNVVDILRESRKKNLARYESLTDTDREKSSLHPRLKVRMTAVDLAWFDAEHDDHHLARISEIIATLKNSKR